LVFQRPHELLHQQQQQQRNLLQLRREYTQFKASAPGRSRLPMFKQYAVGSFLLLQCILLLSGMTLPAKGMDDAGALLAVPEEEDLFDEYADISGTDDELYPRMQRSGRSDEDWLSKKRVNFLRFGRKMSNPNFLRFGRASNSPNFLRFGRRAVNPNFLRFGRKLYSNRQDRAVGNFLRFG
ncbi:hypothetical protein M514_11117, partial [Trichuris suis]